MAQKTPVNTTQGLLETAQLMARDIVSPIKLTNDEQIHFDNIINSKSRRFWENGHFVQIAATTAQLMVLNNHYMQQLITQGPMVEKPNGEMMANPMHNITKQTQSLIGTNLRLLGMSANLIDGEDHSRYEKNALKTQAKVENTVGKNSKISLLG